MSKLIFEDSTWNFDQLVRVADEIDIIGREEMGMDPYPGQIEIVTYDQMLDVMSGSGLPNTYQHWSFGKAYTRNKNAYVQGQRGLAYECVINTNPSIAYCMEDNSASMQALVISHALIGHSHVYKNNYSYVANTDADSIIDYMEFARNYIRKCEETYGIPSVEAILDVGHALMWSSMTPRKKKGRSLKDEQKRFVERQRSKEETYHELWSTVPKAPSMFPVTAMPETAELQFPEHNLLYFIEKNSPVLRTWQREILRITRKIAEFYYPGMQISVLHESAAVYSHMFCMRRLYEKGFINEGHMLESYASNANVVYQSSFERWNGFNIYTLGWGIAKEIERISMDPTDEDRLWFKDWAGNQETMKNLRYAWDNFRDESFIRQYLSPKMIRDMKMFRLLDQHREDYYEVDAIHDDEGYRAIRNALADQYLPDQKFPVIAVTFVSDDGTLQLTHYAKQGKKLNESNSSKMKALIQSVWGRGVDIKSEVV